MKSIKSKLILICVAVIFIVMSICGTVMLLTVRSNEYRKARDQLHLFSKNIQDQIIDLYDGPAQFNEAFDQGIIQAPQYDTQGGIMDDLGNFIAPNEFRKLKINDSAVVAALAGSEGFSTGKRWPDLNGTMQEWIIYTTPVYKDGELYVVFARMNAQTINRNLIQLAIFIIITIAIALVLTGVIWFVFADTLTRPIVALTKQAKDLAEGNLESAISVHSNDEIGQLTESFNHMARELNKMLMNISSETNKRGAILQNMTDGVLAYDASGALIHANTASGELLQFEDIKTTAMDEVLKRLDFETEDVYQLPPDTIKESTLLLNDRYISACVTPYMNILSEVDGFVVVLQDVTKMTKLDLMRKEFVANVSHELRTPLTSVKTYTETLLNGAIDDRSTMLDFLKVIDNETQRMALLVTDLLELSRLDDKTKTVEREVIDLTGLLNVTVRQCVVLAEQKNQKIIFNPPGKPFFIEANASRVIQVISNIITNSIKYSPDDTTITVSLEETEKHYRIFIRDQGIGIPKNDIPHIFERFYRVDKARSRAMGGTGLGLAIAKEIMEEHNGKIYVSSNLGAGTTMTLRFPRYKAV